MFNVKNKGLGANRLNVTLNPCSETWELHMLINTVTLTLCLFPFSKSTARIPTSQDGRED